MTIKNNNTETHATSWTEQRQTKTRNPGKQKLKLRKEQHGTHKKTTTKKQQTNKTDKQSE